MKTSLSSLAVYFFRFWTHVNWCSSPPLFNLSKSFHIEEETVETSQDSWKSHFSQIVFQKGHEREKERQMSFPRVFWEGNVCRISCFFHDWCSTSVLDAKECYDNNNKLLPAHRQLVCQTLCGSEIVVWHSAVCLSAVVLTWGHSWVVFDQHPMQQKGSLESVAGHLPWLSCWWRRCSPASRVLFFPSYYFRCRQQQNTGPAAGGFIDCWWTNCSAKEITELTFVAHE